MFKNKIILVTGGTGSFGNCVLPRFLDNGVSEIRIFSRDEKKQEDLRKKYNNKKLKFYIGDVRDYRSVLNSVRGCHFIFHAAALKQVPSCEFHPMEAVKTNILGTENVLEAAIDCAVNRVIVLSTDKAVYPINAMGISKAMMEKVAIQKSRLTNKTIINITRYGNVMASRGSVIPSESALAAPRASCVASTSAMALLSRASSVSMASVFLLPPNSGMFVSSIASCRTFLALKRCSSTLSSSASPLPAVFPSSMACAPTGCRMCNAFQHMFACVREIARFRNG